MVGVREEVAVLPQTEDPNVTGTGQVMHSFAFVNVIDVYKDLG